MKLERFQLVTLTAWLSRSVQAVLQLLIIIIITGMLDANEYTVFILISGLITWYMLADIGIGISLQNKISECRGNSKDYLSYIKSSVFIVLILFIIYIVILYFISNFISDLYFRKIVLDTEQNLGNLFFVGSVLMMSTAIFGIIYKVWYAVEKGYLSTLVPAIATLCSFILLKMLSAQGSADNDLMLVVVLYFIPQAVFPLLFLLNLIYKVVRQPKKWGEVDKEFLRTAFGFFVFALFSAIILQFDYIVMSQILQPLDIIIYNTFVKIFGLGLFVYTSFLFAVWPVIREKLVSGKFDEVTVLINKYLPIGLVFMFIFTLGVGLYGNDVFTILVKNITATASTGFILLLGIYYFLRVWTDTFAMILQSANELKPLRIALPFQALVGISLQIFLGGLFGVNGIVLGLLLSFVLTVSWYFPFRVYRLLNSKGVSNERL